MKAVSLAVALVSGLVAGTAFAGAILALGVIARAVTAFGGDGPVAGVALTLGAALATFAYMAGVRVPLGAWACVTALALGGAFVGMISAALAELLELLPVMLVRSRVEGFAIVAVVALMAGKAAGAVLAALM